MERPVTRAASRASGLLTLSPTQPGPGPDPQAEGSSSAQKRTLAKNKRAFSKDLKTSNPLKNEVQSKATAQLAPKKKSRTSKAPKASPVRPPNDELPHNLGKLPVLLPQSELITVIVTPQDTTSQPVFVERSKDNQIKKEGESSDTPLNNATNEATDIKKRKGKGKQYRLTPGETPFPDWPHPTVAECEVVNTILTDLHGEFVAPKTIPEPSLTVTGCGEVPSVLDALIRTLLSGATTSGNSARAFAGLVKRFGTLESGIGKGSVNWEAVRQASLKDVFEAIKSGGLATTKSKHLKGILDMVHEENRERHNFHLSDESKTANEETNNMFPEKIEKDKLFEITCVDEHFLSLNRLHNLSTDDAMNELTKYPGIGPKTAACVILFCLQRPCFAVDTHIFRLCKWLGWLPLKPAPNEITAFKHLEVRIPDHLKYSLHQLFIQHGKYCPRCRAITRESSEGWDEGCVIEHLIKRTGFQKGVKREQVDSDKEEATPKKKNTTRRKTTKTTKKTVPKKALKKVTSLSSDLEESDHNEGEESDVSL
ncbi:hypothetical protein N7495_007734 [Penicillium taxi]|uniref:uncharacterized protein n=1 Tax=Penicillium taxi TaxID=168475 RepID=UPI0025454825|nr:uncharacterized protein N7495_007734 [Penicillium taxi]KAJ5887693.1 hypothetical protein N7495_007734 [Penicillium taxi]